MFAVLYVPQFSLQAVLRHEPELWPKPLALVDSDTGSPVVCELTERARADGISPGQTPTQAMARCPTVLLRPRSVEQEEATATVLLECAYAFSPHLEATAPGVCTLDLHGLATLSLNDRMSLLSWGGKLQRAAAGAGLSAAIGIGPTPNVARQVACWGSGLQVVDEPKAFLASLPVRALEPSRDVAQLLDRWGIRSVGELLALGQEAVTERLGLEAWGLFAAASPSAMRPLHLGQPPERFQESFEFEPEVETLEPLLFLLRRFVDQLSHRLSVRGLVAESLLLQLNLESEEKLLAHLRVPQPTAQPDVLFRALFTYLENLRASSPVKRVSLLVQPSQGEQKQLGLFETVLADPRQFKETLARLVALLGPDRVGTPALENSHRPDAFHLVPPDFENAPVPIDNSGPALAPRPVLRRFRPALKAEVEARPEPPQQWARPVAIRCAIAHGKLRVVLGPWRSSGHWWEPASAWARQEWDTATTDGLVLRLVQRSEGWFVEGIID